MAITRDSTQDLDQIGKRVRILTGIESTEIDDTDLSELITMASEWFETQSGLTYTVNTEDAYDNAVVFYASYLGSIAQNGMGVENLKIGDIILVLSFMNEVPFCIPLIFEKFKFIFVPYFPPRRDPFLNL